MNKHGEGVLFIVASQFGADEFVAEFRAGKQMHDVQVIHEEMAKKQHWTHQTLRRFTTIPFQFIPHSCIGDLVRHSFYKHAVLRKRIAGADPTHFKSCIASSFDDSTQPFYVDDAVVEQLKTMYTGKEVHGVGFIDMAVE